MAFIDKRLAKVCNVGENIFRNYTDKHMFVVGDKISYQIGNYEKEQYHYRIQGFVLAHGISTKGEPMYLLSIIESIARLRKIRVILLGNATSIVNPYFDFFNIHLPYNSEFQLFKNKTILVEYIKNENGEEVDAARHPQEVLRIPCDKKVDKFDLIRINFFNK